MWNTIWINPVIRKFPHIDFTVDSIKAVFKIDK